MYQCYMTVNGFYTGEQPSDPDGRPQMIKIHDTVITNARSRLKRAYRPGFDPWFSEPSNKKIPERTSEEGRLPRQIMRRKWSHFRGGFVWLRWFDASRLIRYY
jgi:hypothetical protein